MENYEKSSRCCPTMAPAPGGIKISHNTVQYNTRERTKTGVLLHFYLLMPLRRCCGSLVGWVTQESALYRGYRRGTFPPIALVTVVKGYLLARELKDMSFFRTKNLFSNRFCICQNIYRCRELNTQHTVQGIYVSQGFHNTKSKKGTEPSSGHRGDPMFECLSGMAKYPQHPERCMERCSRNAT